MLHKMQTAKTIYKTQKDSDNRETYILKIFTAASKVPSH